MIINNLIINFFTRPKNKRCNNFVFIQNSKKNILLY
jgi:hypothetical protein